MEFILIEANSFYESRQFQRFFMVSVMFLGLSLFILNLVAHTDI